MRSYYLTGLGLTALASGALAWAGLQAEESLSPIFPVFMVFVGAIVVFGRWQRDMTPVQRAWVALIVTVLFVINYRYLNPLPIPMRIIGQVIGNYRWLIITQFCCALMMTQLLFKPHRSQTMNIGLLGLTAVLTAGMSLTESRAFAFYGVFGVAYMGACLLLCVFSQRAEQPAALAARRVRWMLIAMTVFFVLIIGYIGGDYWYQNNERINSWFSDIDPARMMSRIMPRPKRSQEVGFSDEVKLDSMTRMRQGESDAIALRVFADRPPGYLRANVLDRYENNGWDNSLTGGDELAPLESIPQDYVLPGKDEVYLLTPLAPAEWKLDIWPDSGLEADVFSSLDAVALEIKLEKTDDSGVYLNLFKEPKVEGLLSNVNYLVARAGMDGAFPRSAPYGMDDVVREACMQLPDDLSPQIRELATEVFTGCRTPADKHAAAVNYFHDNYTYKLGIQIPEDRDPLDYFLLDKPAAHCEYFASGAIILLRLADVPARMATGFVVAEKHPVLDCWIARNAHAHAWAEAWDADKGRWVTLEPTPPEGQPDTAERNRMDGYWDAITFRLQQLRVALYRDGIKGILLWLLRLIAALAVWLVTTLPGWIILAAVFAWFGRRYLRYRRLQQAAAVSRQVRQMRRLLEKKDRRLKKRNLVRRPAETVHDFAQRVTTEPHHLKNPQSVAQWYRNWAKLRYQQNPTADDIDALRDSL